MILVMVAPLPAKVLVDSGTQHVRVWLPLHSLVGRGPNSTWRCTQTTTIYQKCRVLQY